MRAEFRSLINSFRARLLLVLALLVVSILGVQYYLNWRAQKRTAVAIAAQESALNAGLALAVESVNSGDYLIDLQGRHRQPLLAPEAGRVTNILIVDGEERVEDSLDPKYGPVERPDGSLERIKLTDVPLPPLVRVGNYSEKSVHLPRELFTQKEPGAGEPRAVPVRIITSNDIKHIIVVLGPRGGGGMASSPAGARKLRSLLEPVKPLIPTLFVMLAGLLIAYILVWRFTGPVSQLSEAARRVAGGELDFQVPVARRDEIGALTRNFNEMLAALGRARELKGRLRRAERAAVAGRLTAAVAHEIKNPLNYINLALDHLRSQFLPEDAGKRQVFVRLTDQIKAEVTRINRRITEFLNYARPSKLDLRPIALRPVVEDALKLIEAQASEGGVTVTVEEEGEVPAVIMGDREALHSVFTNLLINGLQAIDARPGGRISVRLGGRMSGGSGGGGEGGGGDGGVRVRITDTGPGISPENLSQIFEPYFSTKETGTGLGLAIVKKVVEDHGGTISVESEKGEGTTFTVWLPRAAPTTTTFITTTSGAAAVASDEFGGQK